MEERVRRRPRHGVDPDQPHPLGSRPGPAVLLAAVPRGQPDPHLRPPARHPPRGRVRASSTDDAVLPGAARRRCRPTSTFHELVEGARVRDRPRARSRARGSTTRGSRSPTASTSTARRSCTAPTPRRSPTSCSAASSSSRPTLGAPLAADVAAKLAQMRAGVVALAKDADLLIYDTQFTPEEYRSRPHWGHSRPDDAIEIARDAGVKRLCLFHHAPDAHRRRERRDPRDVPRRRRTQPATASSVIERVRGPRGRAGRGRVRIRFWGVRGSIPAPGPETNRYGGNTSCVSVHTAAGELIIIDMGTGLMHLGNALMAGAFGKGTGPRRDPAVARALGSHPGPRLLRAGVRPRQPVHAVGPGRLVRRARGHPRGPDGSELLAAADAEELSARRSRCAPRRSASRSRPRALTRHRARASARRDDRARVPHRGGRPLVRVRVATSAIPTAVAPPEAIALYHGADVLLHDTHVPARRSGHAPQPRLLVVRRRVRRRDRRRGSSAWSCSTTIRTTPTTTSTRIVDGVPRAAARRTASSSRPHARVTSSRSSGR